MDSRRYRAVAYCAALELLAGCSYSANSQEVSGPRMANPATKQCIEDGRALEPIISNGVVVDHYCVDRNTGKRCKEWEYFRKECTLPPPGKKEVEGERKDR